MKVKELMEALSSCDAEAEVILQKDGEGNGYSPLYGADPEAIYVPDTTWSGEVYDVNLPAEDHCMEESEWEALKERPRCVVLHPVN